MDNFVVYNNCKAAALLSGNGLTCDDVTTKAINDIKKECVLNAVSVTYWNNNKVSFTSIYQNTITVPAKALKSVEAFKTWNIERIKYYSGKDRKRIFGY